MSGADRAAVLKPKSPMDRRLARLEQMRVWEYAPGSFDRDIQRLGHIEAAMAQAAEIAVNADTPTLRLRAITVVLACIDSGHRIDKEAFQDRTYPVLQRVELSEMISSLPKPAEEEAIAPVTDDEKARSESISLLRAAIALLSQHGVKRPGLVLLRRGNGSGG
jgi:hypothetical protein